MLVSSSDDRRVILWNWETGNPKLVFQSGHNNNVFQAKFMPYTDDRSIVTCAADGQVLPLKEWKHVAFCGCDIIMCHNLLYTCFYIF